MPHRRVEPGAAVLEQELGEAADVPDRRAQVVGDGVEQRLQLGGRAAQRRAALGHPPLQLGALLRQLLAQPGVLDRDRERGRDLERDVPVLGVEGAGGVGREVHLADGLAVRQQRDREHAPHAVLQELPEDRRRRLHGGEVLDVAHRAAAEHLARARACRAASGAAEIGLPPA